MTRTLPYSLQGEDHTGGEKDQAGSDDNDSQYGEEGICSTSFLFRFTSLPR